MNKLSFLFIILILCGMVTACSTKGIADKADIDYGTSEKYKVEELEVAAHLVFEDFERFNNCELIKLKYSEEDSLEFAANDNNEIIVFVVDFITGGSPPEGFMSDSQYSWKWILEREDSKSEWEIMDYGEG